MNGEALFDGFSERIAAAMMAGQRGEVVARRFEISLSSFGHYIRRFRETAISNYLRNLSLSYKKDAACGGAGARGR
jgi:transposase